MVPEGWEKRPLGEVCASVVDCVNKTAPVVPYETPYRMIRTSNVRDGKLSMEGLRYVEADTFETWTRRGRLQDNDVILTREAPVGEIGIVKNSDGLFLGQRTMLYRAAPDKLDQLFLYQSMMGRYLQSQFLEHTIGGTVGHIKVPDCSAFHILLPPLPEQKKIAEILSTWDRAIEVAERQLETARLQKKALMQQLLTGTRRLPGFDGEWKTVKLGDICELVNGRGFKPHEWSDEGYPIIRIQNLNGSDEFNYFNGSFNPKLLVLPGDLLFAWSGSRGTSFGPHIWNGPEAVLNYHTWNVKPREDLDKIFFYWLLQQITALIEDSAHGAAALVHTQKREMEKRFLAIPRLDEQKKIASTMALFLQNENNCSRKLFHLRTEKRALMQQLLTGKKRVKV